MKPFYEVLLTFAYRITNLEEPKIQISEITNLHTLAGENTGYDITFIS